MALVRPSLGLLTSLRGLTQLPASLPARRGTAGTAADHQPPSVTAAVDRDGVATVTLTRPKSFNTMHPEMIDSLSTLFQEYHNSSSIRAVFVKSTGRFFSAGADLRWMKSTVDYTHEQNLDDAVKLGTMLHSFNTLPMPTVAFVQGE